MEQEVCCVCGQPLVGNDVAECDWCFGRFHVAMTISSTTQDCGIIDIDPRYGEGLIFLCFD